MESDGEEDFADALLVSGGEVGRSGDVTDDLVPAAAPKAKGAGGSAAGGAFGSMGLLPSLNKAIIRKGFKTPTPIQRKTIPVVLQGRDVVGMARTGSGKTAAFVIPMIQRLKAHTARQGVRAVIMSPSRELALQTLKVVKELGKGTDLRSVLLVGGDSLEEHFAAMSRNPDIVVATPGRFLHIKVEMRLDLSTVEYIVFDEADRLFEMGFAAQLTEILHALPSTRQSLLFSATLPVSLVEFARAGLTDPLLVRLDADSKISTELESAFISVQTTDKEGALLYLLSDVIKLDQYGGEVAGRGVANNATIIFACTKHHVDYLAALLRHAGYRVSYVYGSLDQTARRQQVDAFKAGTTNVLVVTDVAARGIDIPILANVINYDFPAQPKVFVHRVGRTARAGKRGWAYSLVRADDAPYLLDLQLFLARRLVLQGTPLGGEPIDYTKDIVLGSLPRDGFDKSTEWTTRLLHDDVDLMNQKRVAQKGEKLYLKTRTAAATDSVRRAKELIATAGWKEVTPLLRDRVRDEDVARLDLLKRVGNFRPAETVFEIGSRGQNEAAGVMRTRRDKIVIDPQRSRPELPSATDDAVVSKVDHEAEAMLATFTQPQSRKRKRGQQSDFRDDTFMSHYVPNTADKAYDVGDSFAAQARGVALDLVTDEGKDAKANAPGTKRWDVKKKRFVNVANDLDGSRSLGDQSKRFVTGESGVKIPATYRAGRFEAWRNSGKATKAQLADDAGPRRGKFVHRQDRLPKMPDRARDDYEKQKLKFDKAKERIVVDRSRSELKSAAAIRKDRMTKQKRKDKNARPKRRK